MWQGAEAEVDLREVDLVDLLQRRQVKVAQEREHLGHRQPRLAVGGEGGDPHRGMGRDQADKLGPGVAGGPENGDLLGHGPAPC